MMTTQATEERTGQTGQEPHTILKAILIIAGAVLLVSVWYHGTFDLVLVNVGMNAQPCIQLYYGQTLCGDPAKDFCHTQYSLQDNGKACDEILGH